ncbi:MAG: transposase, partial [Burkholderiaceae bacterium]|nr:transposase [Burkholderiaceae bacterium]
MATILLEQIRLLHRERFGKTSEKQSADSSPEHLPLFDLPEPEDVEPAKIVVEEHRRKKSGRRPLPVDLPRVEVLHDLEDREKICACGCELRRIG